MRTPVLLALDWGSTNLKAYLLNSAGVPLETRNSSRGIQQVQQGRYMDTLREQCGDWLDQYPEVPIIAAGMIGSREGWRETPYALTPTNPASLAKAIIRIDDLAGRPFALVPGLCDSPRGGPPDVMRGVETEMLGALNILGVHDGVFVLPGFHCKWVVVKEGAIATFRTYMTGELYEMYTSRSLIANLLNKEAQITLSGFSLGLAHVRKHRSNLSHMLFSARSQGLLGQISRSDLAGFLSGLLIGDEITDGLDWSGQPHAVYLIGTDYLAQLYRQALVVSGHQPILAPESATARGLHLLAKEMVWS